MATCALIVFSLTSGPIETPDDALFLHVFLYTEVDEPSKASYALFQFQLLFVFFTMSLSYFTDFLWDHYRFPAVNHSDQLIAPEDLRTHILANMINGGVFIRKASRGMIDRSTSVMSDMDLGGKLLLGSASHYVLYAG